MISKIKAAKTKWEKEVLEKVISKNPERQESFETLSGLEQERVYVPDESALDSYLENLGFPGQYPYTRGVQPTMYRGRLWTMRQYAGFGTARESNERYKYLLDHGQTGLSIAFDLPTQMGYDSDHSMSLGEVGKVGVAIDSLADIETLFDGILLNKVSASMTINATASILYAMYISLAEKQGVEVKGIRGTIQNDILKEYIARGTYIFPPENSMRLVTDVFAYASRHTPKYNTISISGYHMREAGCTAVQEVAFTLANGIEYVSAALEAGLDVDTFAPVLSFFFNVHNNFLEEIAKFRAARRIWARIMKERFKAQNPRSMMLRFHTQTAGSTLTAQQPEVNVVRVAIQALAAVIGGTQSLHTNSRDEALALPTEESVRIALRTQQVIAHETGIADTIDPLGGSFAIESLTDSIEAEATKYISKVDRIGGMVKAIQDGYVQREIQDAAYQHQLKVENKERIVVGVNEFTVEDETKPETLKIDPSIEASQLKRLEELKKKRDAAKVKDTLDALEAAAAGKDNLMPFIIDATKAYATIGEISDGLRKIFGTHKEAPFI